MYFGRAASGMVLTIKMIAPETIPADPTPWIARPMMTAMEFGADPQTAEPSSWKDEDGQYERSEEAVRGGTYKDQYHDHEDVFRGVEGVYATQQELEAAGREHEC